MIQFTGEHKMWKKASNKRCPACDSDMLFVEGDLRCKLCEDKFNSPNQKIKDSLVNPKTNKQFLVENQE